MNKKNEPFKYIGDDYLVLHDTLNKLDTIEQVIFNMNNGGILMSNREVQYIIGGDKMLRANAEFLMAINRVISSDPEKYKKIFLGLDSRYPHPRRIPIMMPEIRQTQADKHSYIS